MFLFANNGGSACNSLAALQAEFVQLLRNLVASAIAQNSAIADDIDE